MLGCSGTFPGPHSGCSSYLLRDDGFTLLVDAGSGAVGALQEHAQLFGVDAVFLSHLHADHCLDLVSYTYARRYDPAGAHPTLPVFGPEGTAARLAQAGGWGQQDGLAKVYDFRTVEAGSTEIGPFRVDLARTNHPVLCHAARFTSGGRSLTYSGDTGDCPELVELARGCDVALFEASWYDGDVNPPGVHLTARESGEHAARAGVQRLLLTHVTPWGDRGRTHEQAARAYRGDLEVVSSGTTYHI